MAQSADRPADFRGIFRDDEEARAVYSEAAGIGRIQPDAVAVPQDVDDLSSLVRWSSAHQRPLIPRGSGSSMAGAAIGPGIIVDLSRWNSIDPLDLSTPSIRAGPGAICADVDRAARQNALRFAVDPSSASFCTVGGMTATNSSGPHSLAFGSIRQHVLAITCVFADGTVAQVRRGSPPPDVPAVNRLFDALRLPANHARLGAGVHPGLRKESSGYASAAFLESEDVIDLLVGSEGTLAFFTDVTLRLIPMAVASVGVLGAFQSLDAAARAAAQSCEFGVVACELLDRTFLEIARANGSVLALPSDAEAILLAEVEGATPRDAEQKAHELVNAFRGTGAKQAYAALDADAAKALWDLRHAASPAIARLDPRLRSMQFIEDGVVPPAQLPAYIRAVRAALDRQHTQGVVFGHAGEANVHVNPLIDVSRSGWRSSVTDLLAEVTAFVAQIGGSVSGEHGDGRVRTPLLDRVWSQKAREGFALIKRCFDPDGLLNPGVKIPAPGQIAENKYDPDLPLLPPRARAALATIEQGRAYGRFRLDLLTESASPSD